MNYKVIIPLTNKNLFDLTGRIEELAALGEWVDELVHWNRDLYSIRYLNSLDAVEVWFNDESHAIICKLRRPCV